MDAAPANPTEPEKDAAQQALERAMNTFKDGRTYEAMGICRDLLAKNPDLVGALGLLGGILGYVGQVDDAIPLLEQAVAKYSSVANWHLNLCVMYRGKNLLDKALAAGAAGVGRAPARQRKLAAGFHCRVPSRP